MKKSLVVASAILAALMGAGSAKAGEIKSYSSVLTGGTLIDFEGWADGTIISDQYSGVTFSQTPSGSPEINNYPWLYGYGSSSGDGVLTGSTEGGNEFETIAGLIATFTAAKTGVQIFLSDTSPLGDYPITIYGSDGSVLDTFTVLQSQTLPPGYTGGSFPAPGTNPLPGIFVGYTSSTPDIWGIQVGPSTASFDAFAVDDLRYTSNIPEPATYALMLAGFAGLGFLGLRLSRQSIAAVPA